MKAYGEERTVKVSKSVLNRKTNKYETTEAEVRAELSVDADALFRLLANKAFKNRSRTATEAGGAVQVRIIGKV